MGKSKSVFTAENMYKEALHHYLLLSFNFPFEATLCIPLLRQTLELLLREHIHVPKRNPKMKDLVKTYGKWKPFEENNLKWLTDKRNEILHEGEVVWEEYDNVRGKLSINFQLIGRLIEDFEYMLSDFLFPWEINLAEGKSLDPFEEATALSHSAYSYSDAEPDISVDIANKAFVLALQGLARGWSIEGYRELSPKELMEVMYEYDDERAPYYEDRRWEEELLFKHIPEGWFTPPMTVRDFEALGNNSSYPSMNCGYPQNVQFYIQEVIELVASYSERTPLYIEKCVKENWKEIILKLQSRIPEVAIPDVDIEYWKDIHFFGNKIQISVLKDSALPNWSEVEVEKFLEIVSAVCGKIPKNVSVEFDHPFIIG